MQPPSAQEIAATVSASMHRDDRCAALLGIEPVAVAPGSAVMRMTVRKDMANGHAICHGGLIFTLADTAFAHACNSYNVVSVAAGCSIEFLLPAQIGDTLTASAEQRVVRGRSGVFDITVSNQHGETVALFRGKSHRLNEPVVAAAGEAVPDD